MFRKGGSVNEGIMHGLERKGYATGSEWENTTPSEWEDIATAYGMSGAVATDYEDPKNIEKWSKPINYDFFNWLRSDKVKAREEKIKQEQIQALQNINAAKLEGIKTGGEQLPPWKKQGFESYADWLAVQGSGSGKGTGTIDDISVSDLNKERMKIFAPHMQKRMINDALAAASEKFGESTGDWKQDAASAISAAAKAMGGTQDIYDKVSMMTLSGAIQKDIEKSKEKKLGNYEFLAKLSKEDPTTFNKIMKQEDMNKYEELLDQTGSTDSASRLWAKRKYPDVKDTFSAAEAPKIEIEDLADGVYYIGMGKDGDKFFKVEGGKIDHKFSRSGVL